MFNLILTFYVNTIFQVESKNTLRWFRQSHSSIDEMKVFLERARHLENIQELHYTIVQT